MNRALFLLKIIIIPQKNQMFFHFFSLTNIKILTNITICEDELNNKLYNEKLFSNLKFILLKENQTKKNILFSIFKTLLTL
jgi:hypothetical protein